MLPVIIPEALQPGVHSIKLILDNSTSHAAMQLEDWLQTQIESCGWSLTIEAFWLPENASWLNQIEVWFSVLQRKLLQSNYFQSRHHLKAAIDGFVRFKIRSAKPIQWTYTVEKLETNLGTINCNPVLSKMNTENNFSFYSTSIRLIQ